MRDLLVLARTQTHRFVVQSGAWKVSLGKSSLIAQMLAHDVTATPEHKAEHRRKNTKRTID